jgi:hypothetical protein
MDLAMIYCAVIAESLKERNSWKSYCPDLGTVKSDSPLLKTKFSYFAKYLTTNNNNGEEYYIVDYLQMDEVFMHSVSSLYHEEAFLKDGRGVLVLHWNASQDTANRTILIYTECHLSEHMRMSGSLK